MSPRNSEFWKKAHRACDKLVDRFLDHPDVSLIDIGYDPDQEVGEDTEQVVLRIHVRERWMKAAAEERVAFPEEVDGIPVVAVLGEYQLEIDSSRAMGTDATAAASVNDEREHDDLQTITDIGPAFSAALHRVGIHRFADLAEYTPEELSKVLLEQGEVRVSPERIEANNWIDQAAIQAWPLIDPSWCQQAAFALWIGHVTDEHGEQVWYTCVSLESGHARDRFAGGAIAPWVDWVLEQAELPIAVEPTPTEIEIAAVPESVTPDDLQLEILGVQVSKAEPSADRREKGLTAEVHFQVSGTEAPTVTADRVPLWIQFHTVDLESGAWQLVASEASTLQPQELEYRKRQDFPIPDLGSYELHTIVLLLPPVERVAFHRGRVIEVIP